MPVFLWEGKDRTGNVQKGEVDRPNEAGVRVYLREMRITPTKVKPKSKSLFGGAVTTPDSVTSHSHVTWRPTSKSVAVSVNPFGPASIRTWDNIGNGDLRSAMGAVFAKLSKSLFFSMRKIMRCSLFDSFLFLNSK